MPQDQAAQDQARQTGAAFLLAGVGGSVDAVGYLLFSGLFMGFMSGNTTVMGLRLGQGQWAEAGRAAFPILLFTLGVFVGALLSGSKQKPAPALGLVACLLAAAWGWLAWGHPGPTTPADPDYFPRVALLAGAMGVQSGALRRVGAQSVHTTFVTGDLTSFATLMASSFLKPVSGPSSASAGKVLLAGVWVAYVLSAAVGAFAVRHQPREALLFPLFLLVVAIALSLRRAPGDPSKTS